MKHLDLFSGIGGFALAARNVGWETVGFCEIDPYCRKVLRKHWPGVPVIHDIKGFNYGIDAGIITGGFPCQPYSQSGQRKGKGDDRDLWPEMFRVIKKIMPRWVVGENVAGFINMELDRTVTDLEGIGYEVEPIVIPACAVDAKHRRDRVWILAHSGSTRSAARLPGQDAGQEGKSEKPHNGSGGLSRWKETSEWLPEPRVDRVVDGLPNRSHRLKGLGNAIVPQVAEVIFRAINEVEQCTT